MDVDPREKRQTQEQAAAFVLKAIEKHDFRLDFSHMGAVLAHGILTLADPVAGRAR